MSQSDDHGSGHRGYAAHKEASRAHQAAQSKAGRNIGDLPPISNPDRRRLCSRDFRAFAETYFPANFDLAWSDDHLRVIAKIQRAVLEGGLFAMAMPRGSGKTTLCETAAIWAMVNGHRQYVVLIGSDQDSATEMLSSIKTEFEMNEMLADDYPEICFPIKRLEGIHQRASGQLYQDKQTHIGWTADEIVLPTISPEGWSGTSQTQDFVAVNGASIGGGAIVSVTGITGRVRGMKHKRVDGKSVRPDLVLVDDPQTDESARSPSQCVVRERILAGAVLGLAGPGKKISGLMTLTVVSPDDLADRMLNRDRHPQWQGERTKMVYTWPTNQALWDRYAELRAEGLKTDRGMALATEFYRQNRAAMDEGSLAAWAQRHNPDELSAIQHAMNLRLRDERAFFAEFQNDPMPDSTRPGDTITADEIARKVNGHARGLVPIGCSRLTAFVDVQGKALFWVVAAWEDNFTGFVVDYGAEPDQRDDYFTLRDLKRTLADAAPNAGAEGAIYAGLERFTDRVLGRKWARDDGSSMQIERCLIDANWGTSTEVVYQFCRQSRYSGVIMPSHGKYVGAASRPFSEYTRRRGDRVGLNWKVPALGGKRAVRHVVFDTNYWKSFVRARLAVAMGDIGCLSLWGKDSKTHRMLSEHLTSEYAITTQGRGRSVDEWKVRASGQDNHYLDCIVGAAVAASIQGVGIDVLGSSQPESRRKRVKFSELAKRGYQ